MNPNRVKASPRYGDPRQRAVRPLLHAQQVAPFPVRVKTGRNFIRITARSQNPGQTEGMVTILKVLFTQGPEWVPGPVSPNLPLPREAKMKLKPGEIKIFYQEESPNENLDEDLEKLLDKHGFKRWASGYDLIDRVRDLAFDPA